MSGTRPPGDVEGEVRDCPGAGRFGAGDVARSFHVIVPTHFARANRAAEPVRPARVVADPVGGLGRQQGRLPDRYHSRAGERVGRRAPRSLACLSPGDSCNCCCPPASTPPVRQHPRRRPRGLQRRRHEDLMVEHGFALTVGPSSLAPLASLGAVIVAPTGARSRPLQPIPQSWGMPSHPGMREPGQVLSRRGAQMTTQESANPDLTLTRGGQAANAKTRVARAWVAHASRLRLLGGGVHLPDAGGAHLREQGLSERQRCVPPRAGSRSRSPQEHRACPPYAPRST